MLRGKRRQNGFTLLEIMISVGLSSFIMLGVFSILRTGGEQSELSQIRMLLEDSVREALYKMTQELRQSSPSRVTIGAGGNSITFSVPDPSSLVSATYEVDWGSAHSITYAIAGVNNSQLLRTDTTSGLTAIIANDITGVQFTESAGVITITLSAQRTLISGRQIPVTPLSMAAQAEVRNE